MKPDPETGQQEKLAPAPGYLGHRQRLRDRFMEAGADALADYELLEMILFAALPRRDTKALAKVLLKEFGSFAAIITATPARLRTIEGLGGVAIVQLKLVDAAAARMLRGTVMKREALSSWSAILDYLRASMAFTEREQFRILFLNKKNDLIADEVQQEGTVDHTPVYPREVIKRALELSASGIILVHNHPSGDPTPSIPDVDMTKKIVDAGQRLGIIVHDHVIIGRNGHFSFRGSKLL